MRIRCRFLRPVCGDGASSGRAAAFLLAVLSSPLFSVFAQAPPLAIPFPESGLGGRLAELVAEAPKGTTVSLLVERADDASTVFSHNADLPMIPASNQKILTTAAALHYLGADFRYRTHLCYRGSIRDGALEGDLVVIGSGDPSISGRFTDDPDDVTVVFRQWAAEIKERGVTRITGDIVGDDDAFDDAVLAPGWPPGQEGEWYCAEVSALTLNDGCVDVFWRGGERPGERPTFELNPPTAHLKVINDLRTESRSGKDTRWYRRIAPSHTIEAVGTIPPRKTRRDYIAVSGATLFLVSVLRHTLIAEGIAVEGQAFDIDDFADKSPYRQGLHGLAAHTSPPLKDIVREINLHSQNLFAELAFKTIGSYGGSAGSFESGRRAVMDLLESWHVPLEGVYAADGSGLSRLNRVTARALVGVLRCVDASATSETFRASFPVGGGEQGSLRHRFQGSGGNQRPEAGRIRAKTGYIGGVRALSGWASRSDGTEYRFSILLNSGERHVAGSVQWVDDVALALTQPWNLSQKIRSAAVSPAP